MKVSIIVCVYNTKEEYLDKCLNSICTSTLEDYEVLVIDDGSTKDYREIVEKYNPVYVKTENRGLLAARLFGIMIAKGEYIAFVDSDDTVTFNYHAPMLEAAEADDCDIVINDWAFKTEASVATCKGDSTISDSFCVEGDEALKKYTSQCGREQSYFVMWNKLFKKELLRRAKADLEATDAIMQKQVYAEDVLNTFFAFKHAKKVKNIHTGYYFYHLHDEQSVSVSSFLSLVAQVDAMTKTLKTISNNIGNNKYAQEISEDIKSWHEMMARTHYSYAKALKEDGACEYVKSEYKIEKLSLSKAKDSYGYIASGLLGKNFESIDSVMRWIYKKGQDVSVNYDACDEYIAASLSYIEKKKGIKITYSKDAEITIIRKKNSFKERLFHSKFINTLGMTLFPKGSKLRSFFKSKL
ncbi:MAG: glycosyltransferase family 2 protein [Clostridia bacterium]|nr:glycosyltransferase family 2 protein [Clostridia bacterium]